MLCSLSLRIAVPKEIHALRSRVKQKPDIRKYSYYLDGVGLPDLQADCLKYFFLSKAHRNG